MDENISKYMNLKKDWNILDKLPHKLEKTLWKKFISSGDRFFEEQNKNKQLQLDELNLVLKDLKKYEITDLQELLPKFDLINKSKEYISVDGNSTAKFLSKATVNGNVLNINIKEYYKELRYSKKRYQEFREVINAAAKFYESSVRIEKI